MAFPTNPKDLLSIASARGSLALRVCATLTSSSSNIASKSSGLLNGTHSRAVIMTALSLRVESMFCNAMEVYVAQDEVMDGCSLGRVGWESIYCRKE